MKGQTNSMYLQVRLKHWETGHFCALLLKGDKLIPITKNGKQTQGEARSMKQQACSLQKCQVMKAKERSEEQLQIKGD